MGGLFTGAGPTVVRAMALNMGMLASNDQVRLPEMTSWNFAMSGLQVVTVLSSHSTNAPPRVSSVREESTASFISSQCSNIAIRTRRPRPRHNCLGCLMLICCCRSVLANVAQFFLYLTPVEQMQRTPKPIPLSEDSTIAKLSMFIACSGEGAAGGSGREPAGGGARRRHHRRLLRGRLQV